MYNLCLSFCFIKFIDLRLNTGHVTRFKRKCMAYWFFFSLQFMHFDHCWLKMYFMNIVQMVESRFKDLLAHSQYLLKKKWMFGILDDFITKQLPHNVTWLLSLFYAMEHKGDRASISTQGRNIRLFSVTLFLSRSPMIYTVLYYRWAGTCIEVLSISCFSKLFSFWRHSWIE